MTANVERHSWQRPGRFDFLLLVATTVAFFAPYLRSSITPANDSALFFEYFHYFYSGFYSGQGLPRWLPFEAYGVPADLVLLDFQSPANYLMALVGRVLRIEDALLLFKLATLIECLTLLLGVYLLSTLVYRHRATRLFVSVSIIGSAIWYSQLHFNLRFYYLAPLVLYFFFRFLRERRALWLTAAASVGLMWLLGDRAYYAMIWILSGIILCLMLARDSWRAMTALRHQWAVTALGLSVVGALAGGYVYAVQQARAGLVLEAPGRDADGRVTLEQFLSYGGALDLRGTARSALTGYPTHVSNGSGKDISVYAGLPIMLLFWGSCLLVPDRRFKALAVTTLCLMMLSRGGAFATLVYHSVPGMNLFRHLAFIWGLIKVLVIISAGFGLERLWEARTWTRAGLVVAGGSAALLLAFMLREPMMFGRIAIYAALFVMMGFVWGYANARAWQWALLVGLLLDLSSFQAAVFREVPRLAGRDTNLLVSTRVRSIDWQSARSVSPQTVDSLAAWMLAGRLGIVPYGGAYTYAHFDPCTSLGRLDFMTVGVSAFSGRWAPGTEAWNRMIGCNTPKVRVVDSPARVDGHRVYFDEGARSETPAATDGLSRDRVHVVSFGPNAVTIRADDIRSDTAWLVYADAYHAGWTAARDDRPVELYAAFDAFKAVKLARGSNLIRLEFRRSAADAIRLLFAACGALFAATVLAAIGWTVAGEWTQSIVTMPMLN